MWRIGHNYADQRHSKVKNDSVLPKLTKITDEAQKKRKKVNKSSKFSDSMIDPKTKRASLLAFEHLVRRRSSRLLVHSSSGDLKHGLLSRRTSEGHEMRKLREIQEKINRAVTDFDSYIMEGVPANDDLLQEIEEGLSSVEDDMMRINITALIGKHRRLQLYMQDNCDAVQESLDQYDDKMDALQSLQDWLDKDHFESVESDEIDETFFQVLDNEKIEADIN